MEWPPGHPHRTVVSTCTTSGHVVAALVMVALEEVAGRGEVSQLVNGPFYRASSTRNIRARGNKRSDTWPGRSWNSDSPLHARHSASEEEVADMRSKDPGWHTVASMHAR